MFGRGRAGRGVFGRGFGGSGVSGRAGAGLGRVGASVALAVVLSACGAAEAGEQDAMAEVASAVDQVASSAEARNALSAEARDAMSTEARDAMSAEDQDAMNTLSEKERAEGWRLLFDGRSLEGWRGYNMDGLPGGWSVEDGLLVRSGPGGDIITDEQFEDFELVLDWRVEEAGNSGVFYRAAEGEEWIYHSAPEMQVLDDAGHRDGRNPVTSAGSNYGLNPAPRGVVRPAGEWNRARIVVEGSSVEHWLNGTKVVDYELGSPEWEDAVRGSKFVEWPAYGRAPRGHIGLQDHGDRVYFRNLKIREIG